MIFLRSFITHSMILICIARCQLQAVDASLDKLNSIFPNQWKPKGVPDKNDLRCSEEDMRYCNVYSDKDKTVKNSDKCCPCYAEPIWSQQEISLDIEYISVFGHAMALHEFDINITEVYKIEHRDSELTRLPVNLCSNFNDVSESANGPTDITNFRTRIVIIDVSGNRITHIDNLNCLKALDTLDMSRNRIQHLSNSSFILLTHLRVISLSNNEIKTMDTNIISAPTMHLSRFDVSENQLTEVDISNVIVEHRFCNLKYDGNMISSATNQHNISLDTNKTYEGGMVGFSGNMFREFPNLVKLCNVPDVTKLGSLINFGMDFLDSSIGCDCRLEPLMEKALDIVQSLWRDYFNVKCASPEHLKGIPVINVTLDDLVCHLKPKDGCPPQCTCIDKPFQQELVIDCSNKNLKEFPASLPESEFTSKINLNLAGNQITSTGNHSYFSKISNINLSNNSLENFDNPALMNATINLSNNSRLTSLPPSLLDGNQCSLQIDYLILDCDCKTPNINNGKCKNQSEFQCRVQGHGVMPASQFNISMLDCGEKDNLLQVLSLSLGSVIITLVIAGTFAYMFRYEILILLLRTRQTKSAAVQPTFDYDAFFSYDTENADLRKWVNETLLTTLEQKGYKVFLPDRDLIYGDVRATAIIKTLQSTRNFVLILSESYFDQEENILTNYEWKHGWHMFLTYRQHNIVVINYDHMSSFEVSNPQIRAFLRVGGHVNFVNYERDIMKKIVQKLGPKCSFNKQHKMDNKKRMFTPTHLFQVQSNCLTDKVPEKSTVRCEINIEDLYPLWNALKSNTHIKPLQLHNKDSEKEEAMLVTEKKRPVLGPYYYWQ